MKRQFINEARLLWESGHAVRAGEVLYEHLRSRHRPLWAASVLSHCRQLCPAIPQVDAVLSIASDAQRWVEAYDAFGAVRELSLSAQYQQPIVQQFLRLAELVAKITYNATDLTAPFDHNSGWRLVAVLRAICDLHGVSEFTDRAWHIVSCEDFSDGPSA